jgi:hypothetical protein
MVDMGLYVQYIASAILIPVGWEKKKNHYLLRSEIIAQPKLGILGYLVSSPTYCNKYLKTNIMCSILLFT